MNFLDIKIPVALENYITTIKVKQQNNEPLIITDLVYEQDLLWKLKGPEVKDTLFFKIACLLFCIRNEKKLPMREIKPTLYEYLATVITYFDKLHLTYHELNDNDGGRKRTLKTSPPDIKGKKIKYQLVYVDGLIADGKTSIFNKYFDPFRYEDEEFQTFEAEYFRLFYGDYSDYFSKEQFTYLVGSEFTYADTLVCVLLGRLGNYMLQLNTWFKPEILDSRLEHFSEKTLFLFQLRSQVSMIAFYNHFLAKSKIDSKEDDIKALFLCDIEYDKAFVEFILPLELATGKPHVHLTSVKKSFEVYDEFGTGKWKKYRNTEKLFFDDITNMTFLNTFFALAKSSFDADYYNCDF